MKKKYLCVGGCVRSISDGETHYIRARRLAELYRVNPLECYFVDEDSRQDMEKLFVGFPEEDLIFLYPDSEGKYDSGISKATFQRVPLST